MEVLGSSVVSREHLHVQCLHTELYVLLIIILEGTESICIYFPFLNYV